MSETHRVMAYALRSGLGGRPRPYRIRCIENCKIADSLHAAQVRLLREDSRERHDRHGPQKQDDGEQRDLKAQQHIEELIGSRAWLPVLPVGHSGVYLSWGEERRSDPEPRERDSGVWAATALYR